MAMTIACRHRVAMMKTLLADFQSGNTLLFAVMTEVLDELEEGILYFEDLEKNRVEASLKSALARLEKDRAELKAEKETLKEEWARLEKARVDLETHRASSQASHPTIEQSGSLMMFSGLKCDIPMDELTGWNVAKPWNSTTSLDESLKVVPPDSLVLIGKCRAGGATLLVAAVGRVGFMMNPCESQCHNDLYCRRCSQILRIADRPLEPPNSLYAIHKQERSHFIVDPDGGYNLIVGFAGRSDGIVVMLPQRGFSHESF